MLELPAKDFIEALRFALSCAGKNDVRYYINGVAFDLLGQTLTLAGTDGHRGAYVEFRCRPLPADGVWIVQRADVELLLKVQKPDSGTVCLEFGSEGIQVGPVLLRHIDGKFPDWRRVLKPHNGPEPTEVVGLNSKYIAEAGKACARLSNSKYHGTRLELRGPNNAVFFLPGISAADFPELTKAAIIVMPMRL